MKTQIDPRLLHWPRMADVNRKSANAEAPTLSHVPTQRVSATPDAEKYIAPLGPREPLWMRVDRFLNDRRATRRLPS